jgi:predicted amino acid racemase
MNKMQKEQMREHITTIKEIIECFKKPEHTLEQAFSCQKKAEDKYLRYQTYYQKFGDKF